MKPCHRIIRHRDTRDQWYEVETVSHDGRRAWIATLDTIAEARDLVRRLDAAAANRPTQAELDAATQNELDAARAHAETHQQLRRAFAQAGGPGAWKSWRAATIAAPVVNARRAAAAARLRAALAAYRAADEAAALADE